MSDPAKNLSIFFGGFRQREIKHPNAYSRLLDLIADNLEDSILQLWHGDQDSLSKRWRRAEALRERIKSSDISLYLMGYSMGSHLAVRFAKENLSHAKLAGLWLVAPDPKYQEGEWDRRDRAAGKRSAWEEAQELWSRDRCPGDSFEEALREILNKDTPITVMFSKSDPVAEWPKNLEKLQSLQTISKFFVMKEIDHISDLDPKRATQEDRVHTELFTHREICWLGS